MLFAGVCDFCTGFWLKQWVSAGERDAIQVSVCQDIVQNCLYAAGCAVMNIMCLRVLAAGAMVRTALCEDDIAEAGAVYVGLTARPRYAQCFPPMVLMPNGCYRSKNSRIRHALRGHVPLRACRC